MTEDFQPAHERLRPCQRRSRRVDAALQIAIAVLSFAAIWLVAAEEPLQRWGFVVGLASQPFWIAATWRARQHGMLLLSVAYIAPWSTGIYSRFF